MTTVRFAIIADVHLCRSQYGRTIRRDQIKHSLMRAIEAAAKAGVNHIICAGDLLDSNAPGVEVAVNDLMEIHKLLKTHKLSMWCSKGNHDNCTPSWWAAIEETETSPYGLHSLPEGLSEIDGIPVWGSAYRSKSIQYAMAHPDFTACKLAVFHGEILELTKYPTEDAIPAEQFYNEERIAQDQWPNVIVVGHMHVKMQWHFTFAQERCKKLYLISPGSLDITTKPTALEQLETRTIEVVQFSIDDNGAIRCDQLESVEYEPTMVLVDPLYEEEDVEELVDKLKRLKGLETRGAVVYVSYAQKIKRCIPQLQQSLDFENLNQLVTIVAQPLPEDSADMVDEMMTARSIKTSPVQFFDENIEKYAPEEYGEDFRALCRAILTPSENSKQKLDAYVEAKIGGSLA